MPLQTLPQDILYIIGTVLDPSGLHSFILAHPNFYLSTYSLLYRLPDAILKADKSLLLRTLTERPTLQRYIHDWCCDIDNYNPTTDLRTFLALPDVSNVKLTLSRSWEPFLTKYPAAGHCGMGQIRTRMEYIRNGRREEQDLACPFLDEEGFGQGKLRQVCLEGDFTSSELLRFAIIPGVVKLKCRWMGIMKPARGLDDRRSRVTCLELEGGRAWSMHHSTMHAILKCMPCLLVLRTRVPVMTKSTSGSEWYSQATESVSPTALQRMLEPVKGTLRELRMLSGKKEVPYDGSVMDLSSFTQLKKLEITSCCMVPPGGPHAERMDLNCRLSPLLERLKLEFPRESGILRHHHGEGDGCLEGDSDRVWFSRYGWILELIAQASRSLAKVEMVDLPVDYWKTVEWKLPLEIAVLCENANVELYVERRHPCFGWDKERWRNSRLTGIRKNWNFSHADTRSGDSW